VRDTHESERSVTPALRTMERRGIRSDTCGDSRGCFTIAHTGVPGVADRFAMPSAQAAQAVHRCTERRGTLLPLPPNRGVLWPKRLDAPISADPETCIVSGRRGSNPQLQPWEGCTLPLSYSRMDLISLEVVLAMKRRSGSIPYSWGEVLSEGAIVDHRNGPPHRMAATATSARREAPA
jgi:hypothetical protein